MKIENLHDETDVPAGLETRLEALIDRLAESEKRSEKKRKLRLWTAGIAASVAILISTGLFFRQKTEFVASNVSGIREITDPETAYIETKKALELVSRNLNKGLDQLDLITIELEKSNELINNILKN
jgi:hypothetical protein